MKTFAATFLTLMLCISAHARLGETINECIRRYGEPLKADEEKKILGFQKGVFFVMCIFLDGKCESISFKKEDESAFSVSEFEGLREANGGGLEWSQRPDDPLMWFTQEPTRHAVLADLTTMIAFYTDAHAKRENAAKAAEEKKKLEGF
jgi:hypothetical protein